MTVKPVVLDNGPFELGDAEVRKIHDWLIENGSWARTQKAMEQYQADQAHARAEERAQLELQLRAELTAQLRPQLLAEAEKEIEARQRPPLVEAIAALEAAGASVREEAGRLASAGHRLTARRGRGRSSQDTAVAELLDMTLALRVKAFGDFEAACKAAGLMAGRRGGPAKRKGTKAR
ncbi:hypothetical protein [Pelomonas aquatica]|uniref:hypothetical protein n=1 Tax=Pelomonas aquatica TaxID=431058 RepID=UPI00286C8D5E|nr:hypothetical protein [Pelomonas aquatica]